MFLRRSDATILRREVFDEMQFYVDYPPSILVPTMSNLLIRASGGTTPDGKWREEYIEC